MEQNVLKQHIESIEYLGYTVIENVLTPKECQTISDKLDFLDKEEQKEFGVERLRQLAELGSLRAIIEKDDYFSNLILHPTIFQLISTILGDSAILHLQNAIIVEPEVKHGQSHFHRDFAKDFMSTKPLSINAFWIIDDFTKESGATWVVPHTHKFPSWPSDEYLEKNAIQVIAKSGSVFVFDSTLIHRGGSNQGTKRRRAINHQYTRPFIKQQIDLPALLAGRFDINTKLAQVLGFWSVPPKNIHEFRVDPEKRSYRSGQG